jgi:hypothetical protein
LPSGPLIFSHITCANNLFLKKKAKRKKEKKISEVITMFTMPEDIISLKFQNVITKVLGVYSMGLIQMSNNPNN